LSEWLSQDVLLETLSFEDAVRLFKEWGFQVEPGPLPGEVTLIVEGIAHRTYCVYEADMLPQVAAVILSVRRRPGATPALDGRRNGKTPCQHTERDHISDGTIL
jgi:hypothetical protein